MWTATTAQAAPDDSNASASTRQASKPDAADSRRSSSTSGATKSSADRGSAGDSSKGSKSSKGATKESDADGTIAKDADADADETTTDAVVVDEAGDDGPVAQDADVEGPASVPVSTKNAVATNLVTVDAVAEADDEVQSDTVDLAKEQIIQARDDLKEATWDSGNFLAGLAAMLPQMWLGGAHASLERWQLNHALLQEQYAATVGNSFAHWIAGQRIEASIQRTIRVQDQLEAAEKFLPLVGLFGPREEMTVLAKLISQAADNGLVYQILDVYLEEYNGVRRVSPIFAMSINGGESVNVLLDTGSFGLVINPQVIGLKDLGTPIDHGESCYGDCSTKYEYDVYNIPVSVYEGVDSTPTPVLVVTLDTWFGLSQSNGNYEGILGIGPNAYGPGRTTPLWALPGLLSQGILMDYRRNRAILGPNPYAARVTLDGSPRNDLFIKVGDNEGQVIETLLDTGGLVGVIPSSLVGGASSVPDGTLISVYTADRETLLFSYRTRGNNTPEVNDDFEFVLMGSAPFSQMPIYTDFYTGEMALNYT